MQKRKNTWIWVTAALVILSFAVKELNESFEKTKSKIETALDRYLGSLEQSTTQLAYLRTELNTETMLFAVSPEAKKKPEDRDFTASIARTPLQIQQAKADVQVSFDDLGKLIDALAFSKDLKDYQEKLKNEISASDKQYADVENLAKTKHDWTEAVSIKIDLIQPLINGAKIAVFGDTVIIRAEAQVKVFSFFTEFTKWSWRLLFVLGVGLGVWTKLHGRDTVGSEE